MGHIYVLAKCYPGRGSPERSTKAGVCLRRTLSRRFLTPAPSKEGLFLGTIKVLTHSSRGRESERKGRSQCRGGEPLLPWFSGQALKGFFVCWGSSLAGPGLSSSVSRIAVWLSRISLFLNWSLSLYFSYSHSLGIWGAVGLSQVVRMEPNTVRGGNCEAAESTYTKETHQDEQTHRSLGRDWRQSQDQPLGRYHGAASSLPSTPGQPFLPALLQAICHPVSSQWHLEFIIYCGHSRERDTGRVGDKKLHPGPFQQWRGDKTIPWPEQDLRSPKPQERGPCPCLEGRS